MSRKIWIDTSIGGLCFSERFFEYLIEEKDWKVQDDEDFPKEVEILMVDDFDDSYGFNSIGHSKRTFRTHPDIIEAIEELGEEAVKDRYSVNKTKERGIHLIEIPNVKFYISEADDGSEYIAEEHRIWQDVSDSID